MRLKLDRRRPVCDANRQGQRKHGVKLTEKTLHKSSAGKVAGS